MIYKAIKYVTKPEYTNADAFINERKNAIDNCCVEIAEDYNDQNFLSVSPQFVRNHSAVNESDAGMYVKIMVIFNK